MTRERKEEVKEMDCPPGKCQFRYECVMYSACADADVLADWRADQ